MYDEQPSFSVSSDAPGEDAAHRLPWRWREVGKAVLLIIVGTIVLSAATMGVALAAVQAWPTMSPALKLLLTTGLLGGLTTFSTFSAEAFHLLQRGALGWLGAHLVVHVAGSVLMTWAGYALFNALRA